MLMQDEPVATTSSELTRGTSRLVNQQPGKISASEAEGIALGELARRRRRLGALTADQEIALESLFSSTATLISALTTKVLESLPVIKSSADYADLSNKTSETVVI